MLPDVLFFVSWFLIFFYFFGLFCIESYAFKTFSIWLYCKGSCDFKHFISFSILYRFLCFQTFSIFVFSVYWVFFQTLSVCAILCMLLCFQSSSNYRYSVYALVIKTFSIFLYSFVLSKFFYFCLFICLGSCCIIFSWLYHLFFT